jgi:tol-pal system protein YbgF
MIHSRADQITDVFSRSNDELPYDASQTNVRVIHRVGDPVSRPNDIVVAEPALRAPETVDAAQESTLRVTLHASHGHAEVVEQPIDRTPSIATAQADHEYDAALELLNAGDYPKSITAFADFVARHAGDAHIASAMYWLGEAYLSQRDYRRAVEQFESAITHDARHEKEPDALFELGTCHQKLGNPQRAHAYFDTLIHKFPRSDAARRLPL